MAMARIFMSGDCQAVRLPTELTVQREELEIQRRGNEIVLREPACGLGRAFEVLAGLPDDFHCGGREDLPAQKREGP